jgi:hypothetical protein
MRVPALILLAPVPGISGDKFLVEVAYDGASGASSYADKFGLRGDCGVDNGLGAPVADEVLKLLINFTYNSASESVRNCCAVIGRNRSTCPSTSSSRATTTAFFT